MELKVNSIWWGVVMEHGGHSAQGQNMFRKWRIRKPKKTKQRRRQPSTRALQQARLTTSLVEDQAQHIRSHRSALELISGARFSCKLMGGASPGELTRPWGSDFGKIESEPALKFPARLVSSNMCKTSHVLPLQEFAAPASAGAMTEASSGAKVTKILSAKAELQHDEQLSGYLKAVWIKCFGPVFYVLGRKSTPDPPPRIAGACPEHQFAPKINFGDQF